MNRIVESENMSIVPVEISSNDHEQNLTYQQRIEIQRKENMDLFETLGVYDVANNLMDSLNKHRADKLANKLNKKQTGVKRKRSPSRRSQRIAKLLDDGIDIISNKLRLESNENVHNTEENIPKSNLSNQISISIPQENITYFEKLNADISIERAAENSVHTYAIDRYTKVLGGLKMHGPPLKVAGNRIYSLAVHPSETSLIIAAGDLKGYIAFYNKNDSTNSPTTYKVHDTSVNCLSFCSWDPYKLFSTSHDGSVRCGDIVNYTFDMIYNTKLWVNDTTNSNFSTHTTWHTEYERNLLIGCGAGRVDLVDMRTPNKIQKTIQCHKRSVRTVQCHPLQNHYFLTSSALGEVSLWDIRNVTDKSLNPVLQFEHNAVMKSAFFSHSGINMISTSTDNFIRIFNTSELNETASKPVKKIPHNNNTGKWLSVIKAKWTPGRDDIFFTGSMISNPKRIEMYSSSGILLHNLIDKDYMTTYCPVIEAHPTQAIYVGGNSSGRIHIYSA
ncbi:Hypothetical protein CINCED_3A001417 [Cinara cedri]|uniref:WD repeat-containing protein 76 n=1 Tax=Cinara cedri TaxID=506608 RepID=A0A5E4NIZ1_9HEMI|nr:Hypothetical protein CINCED_3A001417 [Cinara cedri]